MATPEEVELRQRAEGALRGGRAEDALALYGELLGKVEVFDAVRYDSWLEGELAAYERLGRTREAGVVLLGLRRFAEAQRRFPPGERPLEWALAAARQGRHAEAARVLSEAGRHALAAIELEEAGTTAAARVEWERVVQDPRLVGAPYETALARCALGECLWKTGDRAGGARELGLAQRALEALADEYEGRGETQRALDCYRILLRLGKEMGSFENVAEGTLNSIRLLKGEAEDQKFYVVQLYDDFLAYATERGETYAAATLAREAAAFSLEMGLVFERHYLRRAVTLWEETSSRNEAAAGPIDLSENALHAAIEAASELDDGATCVRLYQALAALPLTAPKKARYQRLAARGAGLAPPPPPEPGFPDYLRRRGAYQDVTRQDLVEWELDGDATAVLGRLVVELAPTDRKYARLALRAALVAGAAAAAPDDASLAARLARALGRTQVYEVLRPLERLFEQGGADVRAAVMDGVANVYHARGFGLVRRGLADPAPLVFDGALRALRKLCFREGFGALARLFRDATDERVRATALETIADLGTLEAGMFLVERVREDAGPLATAAETRLRAFPADEVVPVVRQALEVETGDQRAALERVVAALTGPGR